MSLAKSPRLGLRPTGQCAGSLLERTDSRCSCGRVRTLLLWTKQNPYCTFVFLDYNDRRVNDEGLLIWLRRTFANLRFVEPDRRGGLVHNVITFRLLAGGGRRRRVPLPDPVQGHRPRPDS